MDDRDIRQRIVDQAVDLFNAKNPNGGGLFTTAHYGQAMKAEFKTPGPTLDSQTCTKHLLQMGDIVEKAGNNLWRRLAQQETTVQNDITKTTSPDDHEAELLEIEAKVESGILRVFNDGSYMVPMVTAGVAWWSVETMASALKNDDLVWDGLLENIVGLALYTMAVDGRVISQPNMLVDGARVTVFTLAPKGAEYQPNEGFGR